MSPDFYNYAMQALERYGDDPRIAGISLNTKRERWRVLIPSFHCIQDMMCIFSSLLLPGDRYGTEECGRILKSGMSRTRHYAKCECAPYRTELSRDFLGEVLSDLCGGEE